MFDDVQRITELLLKLSNGLHDLYDESNTTEELMKVIAYMETTLNSLQSEVDYLINIITSHKDSADECMFYTKYIEYIKEKIETCHSEILYKKRFM